MAGPWALGYEHTADPIGYERIPCECTMDGWRGPCTDCGGEGYRDEPLYPADFVVGLDDLRRELDPTYPEPVCLGCGTDCGSMFEVDRGALPYRLCSGCDPRLEPAMVDRGPS